MRNQPKKFMGLRLPPKVVYLTTVAARDHGVSVNVFAEQALSGAIHADDEPGLPKRFDALYDDDPAVRFLLLAQIRPDLLTRDERRLWNLLTGDLGMHFTRDQFLAAYNAASADKTVVTHE